MRCSIREMTRTATARTQTATGPSTSWINDEVIQLRTWGSNHVYPLSGDAPKLLIGAAPSCAIQIHDPYTSREHAYLEREDGFWRIVDQSKNGLYLDGELHGRGYLSPGMRITIGPRVTLVAESARTMTLRAALARMMGWSGDLADSLEHAFQALRLAPSGKAIFMLCGEGDLFMFAHELHRLTLGEHAPLVVCGTLRHGRPRREDEEAARSLYRVSSGREAIMLACGGTICIDNRRLPNDLIEMFKILHDTAIPTQVFVLAKYVRKSEVFTPTPFELPPLSAREGELDRLITEYSAEAVQRLGIAPLELTAAQRARLRARCETLSDLRKATLRLIALRQAGTIAGAAALLSMNKAALGQWLHARGLL
jgi:hypothetical protein